MGSPAEQPVAVDISALRLAVTAEVWHLAFPDGKQFGPISEAEVMGRALPELQQEGITVWRDGMDAWNPIETVASFSDFIDDVLPLSGRPKPPPTTSSK